MNNMNEWYEEREWFYMKKESTNLHVKNLHRNTYRNWE